MTTILNIQKQSIAVVVNTNEDWLTNVAFVDGGGAATVLDGIAFTTKLRHIADDATVWITAGTATADMTITGGSNVLKFNVLAARMAKVQPGDYVFDVLATADGHTRALVSGTLSVLHGVTR